MRGLEEASSMYKTLNNILDYDVRNESVKEKGSFSRNLHRVRQGLDLIRVLFQNFLSAEYVSHFRFNHLALHSCRYGITFHFRDYIRL